MDRYEYKVLSCNHVENVLDRINSKEFLGWKLVETIQEHGFTKVILEKEINDSL